MGSAVAHSTTKSNHAMEPTTPHYVIRGTTNELIIKSDGVGSLRRAAFTAAWPILFSLVA